MKNLIIIPLLCLSITGFAQTDTSVVRFRNAPPVHPTKSYSHSVEIDLGNAKMVIISGQVAFDKQGNLIGKDDLSKQTEQVFINIKNIIEDAGGTMDNLVKMGVYMIDVSQIQLFRDVRDKFISRQKPTSTLVQVSKLAREDLLIEIEATAVIPKIERKK